MQKQETTITQKQTISPELSYKIMQIGEVVLEIEEDYMHCFGRETQEKIKHVVQLIREIAETEMVQMHADRLKKHWEYALKMCQQGFL